jgi:hypothetical protein
MKKIVLILLIIALTSCFKEEKETIQTQTWVTQTQEIIPKHEKTTSVEEEFSQDLNGLLNLIDEESNE